MQQQWPGSMLPQGFPILVPGPGGFLVPAGNMTASMQQDMAAGQPPNNGFQPQQQCAEPQAPQEEEEEEEEILEEQPEGAQPAPPPKLTRAPTRRIVIGSNGELTTAVAM